MKKQSIIFDMIKSLTQTSFSLLNNMLDRAIEDVKLTGKNFAELCFLLFILSSFVMITWLGLLGIIFSYLIELRFSTKDSLLIVGAINIVALLLVRLRIIKIKNRIQFLFSRYEK